MSIDLTAATAAEMQINRLELPDDAVLVFEDADADLGYITRLTLDQTKDWDKQDIDNPQNSMEYSIVRVIEFDGFPAIVKKSSVIKIDGWRYKFAKVFPPRRATRVWSFKCERIEEVTP